AQLSGGNKPNSVIDSAASYIAEMEKDHDAEGERFRTISALTDEYTPPEDACTTYRVTFSMLEEFEDDLHRHIHLENNILFPRSVELEENF
ncbi:MAG: iron-sulfur cluster repair di-iron protein, partial [Bacteroidales bacterium]|nr:iron-sulfur cluster repair di-iron protein [Bacteroidales bacterium]